MDTFNKFLEHPLVNFLVAVTLNILVFTTAIGGVMEVLPPRLEIITKIVFPACVISGFISSIISIKKSKQIFTSFKAIGQTSVISGVFLVFLIALYAASFAIKPTEYLTVEQFEVAGLNTNQIAQLQKLLDQQGYISLNNLEDINLSDEQRMKVFGLLNEMGFTTQQDVEIISKSISQTEIAFVVTQTAIAKVTSCNITPEYGLGLVSIRKSNSVESEYLGSLAQGQTLFVVGHDGGTVNQDRWWLIEQTIGGEISYGWVASWVVREINEVECMRVEQAPGSN